jgi:competence protein ComEC
MSTLEPLEQPAPARTDFRLVPLALAAWGCTLAVPGLPLPATAIGVALLLGLAAAVVALRLPRGKPRLAPAIALLLLGAAATATVTAVQVASAHAGPVPELAAGGAVVTAELQVRSDPVQRQRPGSQRPAYVVLKATVERIQARGLHAETRSTVVVTGSLAWKEVEVGERVRLTGRLAPTDPGDRVAAVLSARSPPYHLERPGLLDRGASHLRAGLRAAVEDLPAAERGLVPALVVGDVSLLSPELVADLDTAGLTHLSAVSGANLTIMLAFALGLARWCGLRSWALPALGLLCVAGFVILARPEPSVLRAAAMGLVGLAGLAAGSRQRGVPALAAAVTALLLIDPWLGREYGFALSVLATAGILLLGPPCTDALARWMPRWLAAALAIPLAAQLLCTPIVAVLSQSVSLVAIVANLLAGPAVAPATVLGLVATMLAPLSVDLASVPARVAGFAARWIVEVATRSAGLPGAALDWAASPAGIALLVVACAALAVAAPRVLRRRGVSLALAAALMLWLLQPTKLIGLGGWPPKNWVVVACQIGQGDGIVLRAGPGSAVVVDAGPDPRAMDRCLRELGISTVPYVLLSHFHSDHVDGLSGVLRGRTVGEIGVGPLDSPADEAAAVRATAATARIPVTRVQVGEQRQVGNVRWTVLAPTGQVDSDDLPEEGEGSAENDASVVALAEIGGLRILLTGDIEPAGQRALLRSGADVRADVLKVPHHGSRYQDPEFIKAVGARLALISCGEDNDYGHPASSTLGLLASDGMAVARTDQHGASVVVLTDAGATLQARHK